jgi:HPt (histidine-containing phosphotransfer) domain-containing protein
MLSKDNAMQNQRAIQYGSDIEFKIRQHLADVLDFSVEVQDEVVRLARNSFQRGLEEIGTAIENGDPAEVSRLAHRLKGNLNNAGLTELAEIAFLVEKAGKDGELKSVKSQVVAIEDALRAFLA